MATLLDGNRISDAQERRFLHVDRHFNQLRRVNGGKKALTRHQNTPGSTPVTNVAYEFEDFLVNLHEVHQKAVRVFENLEPLTRPFGTLPPGRSIESPEAALLLQNQGLTLRDWTGVEHGTPLWLAISAVSRLIDECGDVIDAVRALTRDHRTPSYGDTTALMDSLLNAVGDAARDTLRAAELLETLVAAGLCAPELVSSVVELYSILDAALVSGAVIKTFLTPRGDQGLFVYTNGAVTLTSSAQPYNPDVVLLAVHTALGIVLDGSQSTSDNALGELFVRVHDHLYSLGLPELEHATTRVPPALHPHGYPLPRFAAVIERWFHTRWRQLPAMLAQLHWGKPEAMAMQRATVRDYETHLIVRGSSLNTPMEDDAGEYRLPLGPTSSRYATGTQDSTITTGSYSLGQDNAAAAFYAEQSLDTVMSDVRSDDTMTDVATLCDTCLGAPGHEVDLAQAFRAQPLSALRPSLLTALQGMGVEPTVNFDVSRFLESSAFSPCTPNVYRPQQMAAMATLQGRNLRSRRFGGGSGTAANPIDLTISSPVWAPSS